MRCPKCGREDCQILTETTTETKGYRFGRGCCGWMLFGWEGWLCGLCGMGESKSQTVHYWVCPDCGRKFKA